MKGEKLEIERAKAKAKMRRQLEKKDRNEKKKNRVGWNIEAQEENEGRKEGQRH